MNVADFLHFQTSFEGDRIIDTAPDKEDVTGICELRCEPLDPLLVIKQSLDLCRERLKFSDHLPGLLIRDKSFDLSELDSQDIGHNELCGVGFCCGDRDFRSRHCVAHIVGFTCDGRTYHIDNAHRLDSQLLCFAKCGK